MKKKRSDIIRATEAQRELPDKRALPLLLKCLEQQHDPYGYVAEALGKLGDPSASERLARQLRVNVGYVHSRDYLYLNAIKVTKGRKAAPLLVEYLRKLVVKMKGQDIQTLHKPPFGLRGSKNRQMATDRGNYRRTVSAMEAVSGKKSVGGTREEVAEFWSKWLRSEYQAKSREGKFRSPWATEFWVFPLQPPCSPEMSRLDATCELSCLFWVSQRARPE